jgi:hypothetical protein
MTIVWLVGSVVRRKRMVSTLSKRSVAGLAVALAAMAATPSRGQDSAEAARAAEACSWSHGGGQLAAVLCEPGLSEDILAAAGRAACSGHALCAAWIYDDVAHMPAPIPSRFEDLAQANITGAIGVWVAEDEMLIQIEASR